MGMHQVFPSTKREIKKVNPVKESREKHNGGDPRGMLIIASALVIDTLLNKIYWGYGWVTVQVIVIGNSWYDPNEREIKVKVTDGFYWYGFKNDFWWYAAAVVVGSKEPSKGKGYCTIASTQRDYFSIDFGCSIVHWVELSAHRVQ